MATTRATAGIGSCGQVGVAEGAQQPEQHRLGGLRVAPEDQEAGDRLEQGRQHHAAQDQLGGGQLTALARDEEDRGHGAQRPEHAADREGPDAERGERPEQQHRRGADAGPRRDAEQERIGQGVAHQDLHHRPGGGQRRADHRGEQHPGQPDLPDDRVGHRCLRVAGQMVGDHLPHRCGAQRHRPDSHAQGHGDQQQHGAAEEGQGERGRGAAKPRGGVSGTPTNRPSFEGYVVGTGQATGLAPEGDHRCGTAPGSHRTSLKLHHRGP